MDGGVAEKAKFLLQLPGASDHLKLFSADLLVDGCFDEVLAGCDGVFHTASPLNIAEITDPQVSSSPSSIYLLLLFPRCKFLQFLFVSLEELHLLSV
jgi:hypothetical protein